MSTRAATVTPPSSAGSHSRRVTGMAASPRPSAVTSARHARSRPCPSPGPVHRRAVTRRRTCAPGQSPATSSTPRLRRSVAPRRFAIWAVACPGGRTRTISQPTRSDATTLGQASPGSGTSSVRSASRPRPAAARMPASGTPAIAHQAPCAEAPARSARASKPDSATDTTDPRTSPSRGTSSRSAGSTGKIPAPDTTETPGPGETQGPGLSTPKAFSAGASPTSFTVERRFYAVKPASVQVIHAWGMTACKITRPMA